MSVLKLISTTGLVVGMAVAASAQAQEVSLEELISVGMTQVVEVTRTELQNKVQESVLTANNMIRFDESEQYATTVTFTDISEEEAPASKSE